VAGLQLLLIDLAQSVVARDLIGSICESGRKLEAEHPTWAMAMARDAPIEAKRGYEWLTSKKALVTQLV
jgi:hypothetical protein